ncbi:MAG: hypothetical protein DI635_03935 [Pseudoxanthomonas suwonensis]|nr:MAG: hypothetical protein DI635_03935 [Pseudoxanthomonas suwonensis]
MTFVNEFISDADVDKYGLKAIDEKFIVGGTRARDWTIERERGIYLRNVAIGGGNEPEIRNQTQWSFYWKGHMLYLRLDHMGSGTDADGTGWTRWRMIWLNGSNGLPHQLKPLQSKILADLEQALTAYRSAGKYSKDWPGYRAELQIDGECVL